MAGRPGTGGVCVLDPTPLLTVTIEDLAGSDDLHLHAGGQGVWVARMALELGAPTVLVTAVGGEPGLLLRRLLEVEGLPARFVPTGTASAAYVHDRRGGDRAPLAEVPARPLTRHELDELFEVAVVEALVAGVCVLAGPRGEEAVEPAAYGRLAADVRANGGQVVADLDRAALDAALEAGVDVLKVSDEQVVAAGLAERADDEDHLAKAMHELRDRGADAVVVSRGPRPALALLDGNVLRVRAPRVRPADPHGGGDSITAGIAVGLAAGRPLADAVRLGLAAGTLNVTRHGLGTGGRDRIERLVPFIELDER